MPITLAAVECISPRDVSSVSAHLETVPLLGARSPPQSSSRPQSGVAGLAHVLGAESLAAGYPAGKLVDSTPSQGIEASGGFVRHRAVDSYASTACSSAAKVRSDYDWSDVQRPANPFEPEIPWIKQEVNVGALKPMQNLEVQHAHNPNLVKQKPVSAVVPIAGKSVECCMCLQPGAPIVAQCGCGYHAMCLKEYIADEVRSVAIGSICCHIHDTTMGENFICQHLPEHASKAQSADRKLQSCVPSEATPVTKAGVDAISQAPAVGRATQRILADLQSNPPVMKRNPPDATGVATRSSRILQLPEVEDVPDTVRTQSTLSSIQLSHAAPPAHPLLESSLVHSLSYQPTSSKRCRSPGVPCIICFGEDSVRKTLKCGAKVHTKCLKDYWSNTVMRVCRTTHLSCPAHEVSGCKDYLTDEDLRDVVTREDIRGAEQQIQANSKLIEEFKREDESYRPMFLCSICLTEHDIDGCCTLPCEHRFCFESLQHHFGFVVQERRLNKLTCPAEGCGFNLRSEEYIHIFHQCLPAEAYHKLLDFLSRDLRHIKDCRHLGCEERVFVDDDDDTTNLQCPKMHRFCADCDLGPHPRMSCEARQAQVDKQRKDEQDKKDDELAWRQALAAGWKPCPQRCKYGGGFKASEECDHVTCQCGFEFCWDCGVCRQIPLLHDNRWHKPSCRYHTKPSEVQESPTFSARCPECKKLPPFSPVSCCSFPQDDGYPHSYIKRRRS